jgi:peptide chain release factor subunit 1
MAPIASRSSSKRRAAAGRGPATVTGALAELLAIGDRRGWVVSCYQKLEPGDRAGEKYRIKLKNRLRRAAERLRILGFSHAEREGLEAALSRVGAHFQQTSNLAGSRGLAVFAADGYFRAVAMPYVLKSRVVVDRTPVVGELVALAEGGTRLLAVVADRRSARFFDVGLEGVAELDGLLAPGAARPARFHGERGMMRPHGARGGGAIPGVGEYRFHNRIREERQRHLASVADAVAAHLRAKPFDGVVVGGAGTDAEALLPHLGAPLRSRVLGVLRLPPKQVGAAEVRTLSLELLADAAQRSAVESLAELASLLGTGMATESVEPTLRALSRGQVRTLIVDGNAEVPGYRCGVGGRLTERPTCGRGEGESVPVADLLDEAIEDALHQRARVAVVHGREARRFDRLAAILRFRAAE